MTAVIQKLYAARARFHAKASQIKQFVRHHQIDGELRRRIEDWFISHWSISKGVNTEEVCNKHGNKYGRIQSLYNPDILTLQSEYGTIPAI